MKYLLFILIFPTICSALELETKNFIIIIESQCEEGEVSCSNYKYIGTNKNTGKSIELAGSSWHTTCSDGITPCRSLGYKFANGNITYYVSEDGLLEVVQDSDKVLLSESGNWK